MYCWPKIPRSSSIVIGMKRQEGCLKIKMEQLPNEILEKILKYLNKNELIKVSAVNRRFREGALSASVWSDWVENNNSILILSEFENWEEENHKYRFVVQGCKVESFVLFLKQIRFLKSINVRAVPYRYFDDSMPVISDIILTLNNLECLVLAHNLRDSLSNVTLPRFLRHLTLDDDSIDFSGEHKEFNNILTKVADDCPHLEHIGIRSFCKLTDESDFSCRGLDYLLKILNTNVRSLQLESPCCTRNSHKQLMHCVNIESLIVELRFDFNSRLVFPLVSLQYFNNLKLLAVKKADIGLSTDFLLEVIGNSPIMSLEILCLRYSLNYVLFDALSRCFPNLRVLYLKRCRFQFGDLINFVKNCHSLKQLALDGFNRKSQHMFFLNLINLRRKHLDLFLNTDVLDNWRKCLKNVESDCSGDNFKSLDMFEFRYIFSGFQCALGSLITEV